MSSPKYVRPTARKSIHNEENQDVSLRHESGDFPDSEDHSQSSSNNECEDTSANNSQDFSSSFTKKVESEKAASRTSSPTRQNRLSKKSSNTSFTGPIVASLVSWKTMIIVSALFLAVYFYKVGPTTQSREACSHRDLATKYRQESDKLWITLDTCVGNVFNGSSSISVLMFVHNGGKGPIALIKDVAHKSSTCFSTSTKPVEFRTLDFKSEEVMGDYGHIIELCKKRVKPGNVILFANLNEIPPKVAKALHSICDVYNPLIPKIVVLLSLVVKTKHERPIDAARDALLTLWHDSIDDNHLEPLVTRVTEQVLLLNST